MWNGGEPIGSGTTCRGRSEEEITTNDETGPKDPLDSLEAAEVALIKAKKEYLRGMSSGSSVHSTAMSAKFEVSATPRVRSMRMPPPAGAALHWTTIWAW